MIKMENRDEILKGKTYLSLIKGEQKIVLIHDDVINAMQEYADQQTKALTDEIEQLKRDNNALESINKQFTEHIDFKNKEIEELKKELNKLYYTDKCKDDYIKSLKESIIESENIQQHLQSRISELENGNEWISVEDRLPINYEGQPWNEVLTINELGKQQVLYYDKEYNRFTTKPHEPKITHWKWLNEPNKNIK